MWKIAPSNQLLAFSYVTLIVKSPGKHTGICTSVTIEWRITILCKAGKSLIKNRIFTQWLFNLTAWHPAVHFAFSSYNKLRQLYCLHKLDSGKHTTEWLYQIRIIPARRLVNRQFGLLFGDFLQFPNRKALQVFFFTSFPHHVLLDGNNNKIRPKPHRLKSPK